MIITPFKDNAAMARDRQLARNEYHRWLRDHNLRWRVIDSQYLARQIRRETEVISWRVTLHDESEPLCDQRTIVTDPRLLPFAGMRETFQHPEFIKMTLIVETTQTTIERIR